MACCWDSAINLLGWSLVGNGRRGENEIGELDSSWEVGLHTTVTTTIFLFTQHYMPGTVPSSLHTLFHEKVYG